MMTSSNTKLIETSNRLKNGCKNFFSNWKWFDYVFLIASLAVIITISIIFSNDDFLMILCSCLGILTTFLSSKGKVLCYFFGIIQTILYAGICFYSQNYINFFIYLVCFSMIQFYGIFNWKQNYVNYSVKPRLLSWKQRFWIFLGTILLIAILTVILCAFANDFNNQSILNHFFDSSSAVFALLAIILMSLRYQEQWIIWIVSDLCQIGLWAYHFVNGTNGLSLLVMTIILTLISIYGLINWSIKLKRLK